jgi:hypothetical protein
MEGLPTSYPQIVDIKNHYYLKKLDNWILKQE